MITICRKFFPFFRSSPKWPSFLVLFFLSVFQAQAQCPPNLDFEEGPCNGLQAFTGSSVPSGTVTVNPTPPIAGRHDIISALTSPALDQFGLFPKLCPNGSGFSLRLGLETTGTNADRVTYTFTIPAGKDEFSLIYHYAIVINNGGGHATLIQPRLTVSVKNLTDNTVNTCSSFDIAYSNSFPLPGFQTSTINPNVLFKNWAANSINLDNNAGKTIEISFTATGCGAAGGTHFGYAYLDINSECSSSFDGAVFCPDDTAVNITAPFGYQSYKWFDINNNVLGNLQTLHLAPPPLSGDSVFVEMTPFNGYGCLDTLTAHLWDTLTVISDAGRDTLVCPNDPVPLGRSPDPSFVYSWSPATGLSNPSISNPVATVPTTTQYVLSVTNSGGGCLTLDTVNVNVVNLNDSLELIGPSAYCTASGSVVVLKVFPADSIQWYLNGVAIPGANATTYLVTQTGDYHAVLFSFAGSQCNKNTRVQHIDIYESPVAGFTENSLNQCFDNNSFVFTNTSTITSGSLTYFWDLGDGNTATTADVTHSYAAAGTYTVKMVVTATGSCSDSTIKTVTVFVSPIASVSALTDTSQCFNGNSFHFVNNSTIPSGAGLLYSWDMGDGTILNTKDVTYSYSIPGNFHVIMTVRDALNNCAATADKLVTVSPSPVPGFTVNAAVQCYLNHKFIFTNTTTIAFGIVRYLWDFGDGTTDTAMNVTHSYSYPGTYLVKMKATAFNGNCVEESSLWVTVNPAAFASFFATPVCVNVRVPFINRTKEVPGTTINYLWDFGNGVTSTQRTPVYSYPLPGTYTVSLTVSTALCPLQASTYVQELTIEASVKGIRYPDVNAIINFPENLHARPIGSSVFWTPATSLDNRSSYHPRFYGPTDQLYTIELKTPIGCITVDTQFVKARKNIKIYVPKSFTPNGDGKNETLRPFLMSFVSVNYFRVYSRWGTLLYEMRSDKPGWDGTFKGHPMEPQTVVWMIEATDVDGVVHREQGTTILMR